MAIEPGDRLGMWEQREQARHERLLRGLTTRRRASGGRRVNGVMSGPARYGQWWGLDSGMPTPGMISRRAGPQFHARGAARSPPLPVRGWPARRSAHKVRSRFNSPILALVTMPWKYPPAVVRKCSGSLVETIPIAIAAYSRPMARHASPHSDFDTSRSDRRNAAASTTSGQVGSGRRR